MKKWVIVLCLAFGMMGAGEVGALNFWEFNPGRIIDDTVFYNANTMTAAEIQRFLDAKVPVCETDWSSHGYMWAVAPCLKDYKETTRTRAADTYCGEYVGGENQSAAQIIHGVAQACGINPQAILVILQKEQGLVTDKWPRDSWLTNSAKANYQYRSAMGMGCPDTAACDSEYYGFFNQVYYGARQYKKYQALPNSYTYRAGRNNTIQWKPNTTCGTSVVYIENQATAGLYNYTPYRPNDAALAAGFGTGDGCSSYGNRNFWAYFTSWFGSTQRNIPQSNVFFPTGNYSIVSAMAGNVALDVGNTNGEAQIMPSVGSTAQYFSISRLPDSGYYSIQHVESGKYLGVSDVSLSSGQSIKIEASAPDSCTERWSIIEGEDGSLSILSACSGLAMDVSGGASVNNAVVHLWGSHSGENQKWQLLSWNPAAISDNTYNVLSSGNTAIALDVSGASSANGANIQVFTKNSTLAQAFTIRKRLDGSYTFTNLGSNKNLDVYGRSREQGANVQIWDRNTSCAQRWYIVKDGDSYSIVSSCSGKALDINCANLQPGENVQIWESNSTAAQKWEFGLATTRSN